MTPPFARALKEATLAMEEVQKGHSLTGKMFSPTAQHLLYEALRDFGWGRFVLNSLLKHPLKNAKTEALLLISLSFLRKNKDRAFMAVDQAVEVAKSLAPKMASLCNAVLRQFLREEEKINKKILKNEEAFFQHPRWWVDEIKKDHPLDWEKILEAGNRPPPMTLRVNPLKTSLEDYEKALFQKKYACTVENGAIFLKEGVLSTDLPFFEEGFIHVQDWGAQESLVFLKEMEGNVLDACAAPGGKAALWLEHVPNIHLTALDHKKKRAKELEKFFQHYHLNAQVFCADCCTFKNPAPFSAILADCPCTGSGVAGRHPDSKWIKQKTDISKFAQMQQKILHSLWGKLAQKGKMLFATCSVFQMENGNNVQEFLKNHLDARLLQQKTILPSPKNDGFFYALLFKT